MRWLPGDRCRGTQRSLSTRGHAIECRIYAEDPDQDFLPQAGPLLLYREPAGPGIRVDSGVEEGGAIAVNYDPLLAKLIASAETRAALFVAPSVCASRVSVLGIRTNIPFLLRLIDLPDFVEGRLHTGFVDEHLASLTGCTEA